MTAIRMIVIECDQCGVRRGPIDATGRAAVSARRLAEAAGWRVAIRMPNPQRGDKPGDLCATCAAPRKLIDILTPEDCHEEYDWIDPYGDTP